MRFSLLVLALSIAVGCAHGDELDAVIGRLRKSDEVDRSNAVWELKELKDPRAKTALIDALKDPARNVRVGAAMVLHGSDWDGPELVAALCRAATDPDEQVREYAVSTLGRIGDPAALPTLHAAKMDPDKDVRWSAVEAIQGVDAALQARSAHYHPPAGLPAGLSLEEQTIYLKAHEEEWTFTVSRISDAAMASPSTPGSIATICERPPVETKGAYHGQDDANRFLTALQRRCRKDPAALVEFRALRDAALRRYPPPNEVDAEK